jgi:hypothetical protein
MPPMASVISVGIATIFQVFTHSPYQKIRCSSQRRGFWGCETANRIEVNFQ